MPPEHSLVEYQQTLQDALLEVLADHPVLQGDKNVQSFVHSLENGTFQFRFEHTYPVYAIDKHVFSEALMTIPLRDGSGDVRPDVFIKTLYEQGAGTAFVAWFQAAALLHASLQETRQNISLNMHPADAANPQYQDDFRTLVALAQQDAGYATDNVSNTPHIIIELMEVADWTQDASRLQFLQEMMKEGCGIAVDDYGAIDSHHTKEILTFLNTASKQIDPDIYLYVKIDGALVQKVLQDDVAATEKFNQCLEELNTEVHNAIIILEWPNSKIEVQKLQVLLEGHDFLVQSRAFDGKSDANFLEDLWGAITQSGQCAINLIRDGLSR